MEPWLLVSLSLPLLIAALLFLVPFQRWRFSYRGHEIEIRNYVFHETVSVDGERAKGTRVGGDHLTRAEHAVVVDGRRLSIQIGSQELWIGCRVLDGDKVIYESHAPVAPVADADPRIAAARLLIADIAAADEAVGADLEQALTQLVAAEADARVRAEAHRVLGGEPELPEEAQQLESLFETLRELHRSVRAEQGDLSPATDRAREALDRLGAQREVEALSRKAQRQRALE